MAAIVEWQLDVQQWRGGIESRLEGVEAMNGLIPEILERLGPQTLTPIRIKLKIAGITLSQKRDADWVR